VRADLSGHARGCAWSWARQAAVAFMPPFLKGNSSVIEKIEAFKVEIRE